MDDGNPHSNFSSWFHSFFTEGAQQQQSGEPMEAEDLKQALIRTTVELESTRIVAQQELKKMEAQSLHLAHHLQIATRERDEARHHCHSLLLALSKPNPVNINPNTSPILEETVNAAAILASSSSSSEEAEEEEESSKLMSSPPLPAARAGEVERGLPERGRLVEAVMKAGPLLQTLMLAGPLPQWRHPPPAMRSFEIPPVSIGASANDDNEKKKRRSNSEEQPQTNLNQSSWSPESSANESSKHHRRQAQFGAFRA